MADSAVNNAQLRAMLEKARRDLEIPEDFKIVTENLKEKAGSISFNTRVIRINEEMLYDPEIVNYLIYHELAHYKLRTKYHPPRFYDLLYSKLGEENVKDIEKRILRKMWEINHGGSDEGQRGRLMARAAATIPPLSFYPTPFFLVCLKKKKRRENRRGNPFTRTSFPSLLRTFSRKSRLSSKNRKKR
jgi:hypothetical protein